MKTKIVYALTSSENDIYLEQTLVSLISLRKHNPDAFVCLVVDPATATTLNGFRASIKDYINQFIVKEIPAGFTQKQASRYIKTTLRDTIDGDFLYIDCDTVICGSLSQIDNVLLSDGDVFMVPDRHLPIRLIPHYIKDFTSSKLKKCGFAFTSSDIFYFNSGVMLVRDSDASKYLFNLWHKYWLGLLPKGIDIDQPPLLKANQEARHVIKELDGKWNCQVATNALRFLPDALIIHYFATNISIDEKPYFFMNKEPYLSMKRKERLTEEVAAKLSNPKAAFVNVVELVTGEDVPYLHDEMHELYFYHRGIYNLISSIPRFLFKLIQKLKNKC